ncbi:hypothetical protein CHARACLAT_013583 [Characodon lateralis]|uniref:Uncharacterized protein n=1 Tax=Characodon lateralis TaxID=208331 RepID=A0ABU7D0V2_9TELE|nr:hypothetical protein [Characodon lateralis]
MPPVTCCCCYTRLNCDPTCVQRQHYLRRGGSAQPVKRHCGIASITAPRSPFSGILKLGSGERRRRRPSTCPDGPFLTRKGVSLWSLGWRC